MSLTVSVPDLAGVLPAVSLAPLSGITSLPFRILNREAGCKFAFLEMICARSLGYNSEKTIQMMSTDFNDRPLGVQLLGNDSYYLSKALERLSAYQYDLLDFNAACPHKKVTSLGKGAALLLDPKKLQQLLMLIVKDVKVPVTVKLRLGWDDAKNAVCLAQHAQDAGVRAVFLHGRTRKQCYRGEIDYDSIRGVKKSLRIPLIASGNIWSPVMAKKMFDETGCDGIIVARGALGNPWIFKEIETYLTTGSLGAKPAMQDMCRMMKRHLELFCDFYTEGPGVMRFRKFYIWYTRGFANIKPLRAGVAKAKSKTQMHELIEEFVRYGEFVRYN